MAEYNSSSAYDLDAFAQPVKKEKPSPELRVVKTRRQIASSLLNPRALSAFAIVIMLISMIVFNRVRLSELSIEIGSLEKEIHALQGENVKLTSALDSTTSLREIAALAEKMGMQRRGEYQTERIYLYQEDKIERTDAAPVATTGESTKLAVISFFSRFKEYMSNE